MASSRETEKPKVRVRKKGERRPKSGMIEVADTNGRVYFKCPCDRCGDMVTQQQQPLHGQEVVCGPCKPVIAVGKPSTRVNRRRERARYFTECDMCGDTQMTYFLPKKMFEFLCDGCRDATRKADPPAAQRRERSAAGPEPAAGPKGLDSAVGGSPEQAERSERAAVPETTAGTEQAAGPAPAEGPEGSETAASHDADPVEAARDFRATCRRCRKPFQLKFKPRREDNLVCRDCYVRDQERKRRNQDKPETTIIFNIECVVCGKRETVDFVPSSLSEPVCVECFKKRTRRD